MKKIAFLFLIRDVINHERLWNDFFKDIDESKYIILINYKEDKILEYLNEYKLSNPIKDTKHGDISLVKAQLLLLEEALKDKDVVKMIFISESCIPLKSFDYVYDKLMMDDKSYLHECKQAECMDRNRCLGLKGHYTGDRHKSSLWCILNRKHSEQCLIEKENNLKIFSRIPCPDEHYFIMIIKNMNNCKSRESNNEIYCTLDEELKGDPGATTFVNWGKKEYKFYEPLNRIPKEYEKISNEELEYLLNSESLFARKFSKNCILNISE